MVVQLVVGRAIRDFPKVYYVPRPVRSMRAVHNNIIYAIIINNDNNIMCTGMSLCRILKNQFFFSISSSTYARAPNSPSFDCCNIYIYKSNDIIKYYLYDKIAARNVRQLLLLLYYSPTHNNIISTFFIRAIALCAPYIEISARAYTATSEY